MVTSCRCPGYDPNKFYVTATDVKGHGNNLQVKFPPEALRQIQELIATNAFPQYRLPSDFIRDAVHHHLHRRFAQVGEVGDPAIRRAMHSSSYSVTLRNILKSRADGESALAGPADAVQQHMYPTGTGRGVEATLGPVD